MSEALRDLTSDLSVPVAPCPWLAVALAAAAWRRRIRFQPFPIFPILLVSAAHPHPGRTRTREDRQTRWLRVPSRGTGFEPAGPTRRPVRVCHIAAIPTETFDFIITAERHRSIHDLPLAA